MQLPENSSPGSVTAADDSETGVQPVGFLLELSADWIISRASDNCRQFFGEYPARLIDEPLSNFTLAQSLHDLRNLLSRQSGSSGIARAYRMRLVDGAGPCDLAFQLRPGRILLEGMPSPDEGFGASFGSLGRLAFDLQGADDQALLDGAARRLRALTGYDFARIDLPNGAHAESCRTGFTACAPLHGAQRLPVFICDTAAPVVPLYPRRPDPAPTSALFRSLAGSELEHFRQNDVGSILTVAFDAGEGTTGLIECQSRMARKASVELHAATELFGQILALHLRK